QEAEKEKNQEAESLLKPGKFFNLADIEDDSEETDSGFVENLDKEQANMDFGVEQAPAPASGFNFDKFFNPNEFEKTLEPTGQQEVMKEEPIQTVEPTVNIEPEVPVDNRLESNETELVSEPNETKPAEIVNLMITPEEIETVEEPVIENKIEEENIIPPVEVYTDVEPASDISPEIVIPKEEEVLPKAEEMNSELTMNNPYLNMSEEEFLNSLPDNDLPLSSIPSTSQEEMPYIPEETKEEPVQTVESSFEPEFDFTTLEPNSNSLEERPIEKEPEIVSPPEEEIVSPVEPIIQENTNSFLFEPLEEEVAPIVSVPEPTVVEPENPSVVVPPIAKEYHTEEPQSVEEKPSAPIFEAGKVNDEVIAFANSLEQKGYHVRIEEYDFEDLYQVVFKIKKDEK
ncbi:MAG: hypothetical protein KH135_06260, partial [Firmicutes bacterium]|nr:hypothetical protein [Bacillota bacterium]